MHHTITRLVLLAGAAALVGIPTIQAETHKRASAPIVITPAAVPDGSNFSRAPFPAARPQNDVLPPVGEAFPEDLPPNTPSTTPDPIAPPPPALAVLQPKVAPGEMPTGRPTVAAAAALDSARLEPTIRSASFESRDQLVDDVRVRVRQSEETMNELRRTRGEMSAEGRTQFDAQASDVKAKAKTLERSLRAADDASASNWESARQQLAADYDAYASALSRLDAAVGNH